MELTSISFLLFAAGVVMLSNSVVSVGARQIVLSLASICFIYSFSDSLISLLPLLSFLLLAFGIVRAMQSQHSPALLWCGLAAMIGWFIYLKKFSFIASVPELPFPYLVLGLSYVLFRVIHLAVDASQGALKEKISALAFFSYTCNFLTFVSGPIQRFEDFAKSFHAPLKLEKEVVYAAFSRIVTGFIKVAVVSACANYVFGALSTRLFERGAEQALLATVPLFCAAAAVYTVHLYYNFSGYMDIVIGIGRLIGLTLPENFNKPFTSRNFLEFWSRWHITLSEWFKVYVFNPLLKMLAGRFTRSEVQPLLAVVVFFTSFFLMGMWHGTTAEFVVYGLAMGAAASANKLWQVAMSKYLGKKLYKELSANSLYAGLCTGMTCAWFAIALTCFWAGGSRFDLLVRALGASGLLFSFAILTLAAAVLLGFIRYLTVRFSTFSFPRPSVLAGGVAVRNLLMGVRVIFIAAAITIFSKPPEFVYRAF